MNEQSPDNTTEDEVRFVDQGKFLHPPGGACQWAGKMIILDIPARGYFSRHMGKTCPACGVPVSAGYKGIAELEDLRQYPHL